jgi:endonuclease/exonuclease/phosphatase family metal-dependent hydrolase
MSYRREIWSLLAVAVVVGGCAVEAGPGGATQPGDPGGWSPGGKADGAGSCFIPQQAPLSEPVDGLVPTGYIPLPSLEPTADGWFQPANTYSEGGTFEFAEHRPEWSVPASEIAPPAAAGTLRVIEWNVERGNDLDGVIRVMRRANADVWILNESDLFGRNSHGVVVAREIARALGMSYFTTSEFYEKRDDRRGLSGNAIVSRYPLYDGRRMSIPIYLSDGGYDWAKSSSEPRCGQRSALSARISVPGADGSFTSVNLVSLHTENKANASVRRKQFDAVVAELVVPGEPTIVAGDLNTISPFEGASFRKYLKQRWDELGPGAAQLDCSLGDDTITFSIFGVIRMRIDWMLLQPGAESSLSCPPGAYRVLDNDGRSDHRPVQTDFVLAPSAATSSSE